MTGLSVEGEMLLAKIKAALPDVEWTTALHNRIWSLLYEAERARK